MSWSLASLLSREKSGIPGASLLSVCAMWRDPATLSEAGYTWETFLSNITVTQICGSCMCKNHSITAASVSILLVSTKLAFLQQFCLLFSKSINISSESQVSYNNNINLVIVINLIRMYTKKYVSYLVHLFPEVDSLSDSPIHFRKSILLNSKTNSVNLLRFPWFWVPMWRYMF